MSLALDRFQLRALRSAWMRSVGEHVRRRLADLKLKRKALVDLLGSNSGDVSKILAGLRKVPREKIDAWVAALQLTDQAEEEFRIAVHLSWATPYIRTLVERLLDEQTNMRALVAHYEDSVELIARHVEPLRKIRGRRTPPAAGA